MNRSKIEAILFDLDGVVVNSSQYHFRAWREAFSKLGIRITREDIFRLEGLNGKGIISTILKQKGYNLDEEIIQKVYNYKKEVFDKIYVIEFIPGIIDFLRAIKRKNIRTALISGSSSENVEKVLKRGIRSMFDVVVSGDAGIPTKPNPDPYLIGIKKLKADPKYSVAIENSPLGIRAAKAAGLKCYALSTTLPPDYLKEADKTFSSIEQLGKYLRIW